MQASWEDSRRLECNPTWSHVSLRKLLATLRNMKQLKGSRREITQAGVRRISNLTYSSIKWFLLQQAHPLSHLVHQTLFTPRGLLVVLGGSYSSQSGGWIWISKGRLTTIQSGKKKVLPSSCLVLGGFMIPSFNCKYTVYVQWFLYYQKIIVKVWHRRS
jgi:hypothetical protein